MILEQAVLNIKPNNSAAFEQAFTQAGHIISAMPLPLPSITRLH